jgi:hypothetical protein
MIPGRSKITTVAAGGAGLEAAGVWVGIVAGIFTALGIALTLIISVRAQARQQDNAEYQRGYRDGINSCQPELWSLRGRLGITRAPYQPYADHEREPAD